MSGFYKKAVVWLGLNEEYPSDDFAPDDESVEPGRSGRHAAPAVTGEPTEARAESSAPHKSVGPTPTNRPESGPSNTDAQRPQRPNERPKKDVESPNRYGARPGGEGTVRAIPMDDQISNESPAAQAKSAAGLAGATVRAVPMAKTVKPQVVVPTSFNDAQDVGDMFREKKPVIVNMQTAERDLARRMIDFSSGLCYGLGGQMEKVAKDVYLLTPDDVVVAEEHRVVPSA